jgi:hypothetical protein
MAKLETPLRIFEQIEAARSAGNQGNFGENLIENVKFTPVSLK